MDEKEERIKEFCKLHYSDLVGLEYDSVATIWCAKSKDGKI